MKFKEFNDKPEENKKKLPSDVPTVYDEVIKPELDSINELKHAEKSMQNKQSNVNRIRSLANRIIAEDNAYRARHLVRNLEKSQTRLSDEGHPNLGRDLQGKLEGSVSQNISEDSRLIRGIGQTLEYLSLNKEEKKNFSFNEDFGEFGLYETIGHGEHQGDYVLSYAKIGGDAKLKGFGAANSAEIYGEPEIKGHLPAIRAKIHGNPRIFGASPALLSNINGSPIIEGHVPARRSYIAGDPTMNGYRAATCSSIEEGARPQIKSYELVESKNNSNDVYRPKISRDFDANEKR